MSLDVLTFGLNHHSAPVSVRERVSMSGELIRPALDGLRSAFGGSLKEATILSTCNRTEIYCAASPEIAEHVPRWLADFNTLETGLLKPHLYQYNKDQAVRHAFRVASGLDSMVLGETQILGQMKTAVRAASDAGAMGTLLNQLFQKTFRLPKRCAPKLLSVQSPFPWPLRQFGWRNASLVTFPPPRYCLLVLVK